jgi:hypothetical protein
MGAGLCHRKSRKTPSQRPRRTGRRQIRTLAERVPANTYAGESGRADDGTAPSEYLLNRWLRARSRRYLKSPWNVLDVADARVFVRYSSRHRCVILSGVHEVADVMAPARPAPIPFSMPLFGFASHVEPSPATCPRRKTVLPPGLITNGLKITADMRASRCPPRRCLPRAKRSICARISQRQDRLVSRSCRIACVEPSHTYALPVMFTPPPLAFSSGPVTRGLERPVS